MEVASAILEIAKAQYAPEEKEKSHYRMEADDDEDENSEAEYSEEDDDDEPRIVARAVGKTFTIDNIGQVSMQVKSRTRPLEMLFWDSPTFKIENGKVVDLAMTRMNLFRQVISADDPAGLKALLDLGVLYASQRLEGDEEEATGFLTFPVDDFQWAVEQGKTQMLAEIIKRTGAGIPLDHLVKKSGVELKQKPRFYQGLTVYGKKRYVEASCVCKCL